MRRATYLMAVACMVLTVAVAGHTQPTPSPSPPTTDESAVRLWILDGYGGVQVLPTPTPLPPEIVVRLPGGVTMEMVLIPAGSFMMGSDDPGWSQPDEQPVHEVTIGSDFYMGKYEVTIAQYTAFLRSTGDESGVDWNDSHCPLSRSGGDYVLRNNADGTDWNQPMVEVSWYGSVAFASWVQEVAGGTVTLPVESQWEYAARAGTTTRFSFGDSDCSPSGCSSCELDQYAWWCGNNSPRGTKPVGGKLPNAFGLYDMHGNVWEWIEDDWHGGYTGAPTDGTSWTDSPRGSRRVLRGGTWDNNAQYCRSSVRAGSLPDGTDSDMGFRIVRTQ